MVDFLSVELSRAGLSLPRETQDKLGAYIREMQYWNRTINLTSLHGLDLVRRLIVEPVWIGHQLQMSGRLADVGSGNGCPAIPLYLTRILHEGHLIEARTRRAAFLRHLIDKLDLRGLTVHKSRLEEMAPGVGPVDWITLQAVTPTAKLIEAMRTLGTPTTRVVWITASAINPVPGAKVLSVPNSTTQVWIFGLDQF